MYWFLCIQASRTTLMFIFPHIKKWGKVELDEVDIPALDLLFDCVKILENVYLIKLSLISAVRFTNSRRKFPSLEKSGGLPSREVLWKWGSGMLVRGRKYNQPESPCRPVGVDL